MASQVNPAVASPRPVPKIYKAILGTGGDVVRGPLITEAAAVVERRAGRDVVVCGQSLVDNRNLAMRIEQAANGNCKPCPPHASAGPRGDVPFSTRPSASAGHCFYETAKRKSKKPKAPKNP